jgi:hypothetical protein
MLCACPQNSTQTGLAYRLFSADASLAHPQPPLPCCFCHAPLLHLPASLLEPLSEAASSQLGVKLVLHTRAKGDDGSSQIDTILAAMQVTLGGKPCWCRLGTTKIGEPCFFWWILLYTKQGMTQLPATATVATWAYDSSGMHSPCQPAGQPKQEAEAAGSIVH